MRALLDVNVLIALIDPAHIHYERPHEWWATDRPNGWASCPITQDGFARILSQPAYPGGRRRPKPCASWNCLLSKATMPFLGTTFRCSTSSAPTGIIFAGRSS